MTSPNPRLRSAVAALAGSALGSRALGAVASIVTARALGPSGRGELAITVVVGSVFGVVLSLGIDLWASRAGGAGVGGAAIRRVSIVHLVAAAIVAGVAMAAAALAGGHANVLAGGLLAWTLAASMIKLGRLQGANRMHAYALAGLVGSIVYLAAVAALALLGRASTASFVLATAAGLIVTAAWPCPVASRSGNAQNDGYAAALRFGFPGMLGGLVTHSLYRIDVALVAVWRSPADAGLYSVALAVTEILWVLPNSAAQAIVPRSSSADATLDIARVARVLVVLMTAGAVLVAVLAPFLVPLVFGRPFAQAADAVPLLAAAAVAIGVWKLFSFRLLAEGDARTRLATGLAGLAVMVGVDAWAIPRAGIVGASAGSLLAYTVAAMMCVRVWRADSGVPLRRIVMLEAGDVRALGLRRRSSRSMTESSVDPSRPTMPT